MWSKNQPHLHSLLLIIILFLLVSTTSAANPGSDILDKGRNITDGDALVSAGGSFTLGFFPSGVLGKRYLGIWFTVDEDAIWWVANRDRPLTDARGALVISDTGSLLLLDSFGQVVWSSNATGTASTTVQLLESGNLVLRDGNASGAITWQSFDHPSNTLLPGMKIGKNLWTGEEWYLTSWSSADDPATGKFRYITDTEGVPQNVMLNSGKRIYRTGPWNGLWFSGVTEMATYSDMFIYRLTSSPSEITYGYVSKAGTPFSRLVLTDDGVYRRLVWDVRSRAWKIFFQGPRDVCDQYGRCGAFGLCNASAPSTSFCSCVQGFSPASPVQWKMRDTSSGCRRNMALDCGNGMSGTTDGFVAVTGVKLPDTHNASVDAGITLEECKARCLANCSCLACAPLDMKGGGTGTGCIIWSEDLVDLRYVDGGQSMFLRSVKSELVAIHEGSGRSFPTGIVIGISVTVPLVIILVLLVLWFTKCRRGRNRGVLDGRRVIDGVSLNNRALPMTSVRPVDLSTVINATRNFSEENIIGEGGFGVVYKAELGGYGMVAVKRLNHDKLTNKIKDDFAREIGVMSRFKHDNLVELLSYCQEKDEWILVYEFMQNSSLDVHIFATGQHTRQRASLTWEKRVVIICGTAKGVECLHSGSVIHRDLKPDNILLDDSWRPKIADFATAKPFIEDPTNLTVVQTAGYVAPEYSGENTLTYKCDVYSFGVVLLEIVSGERRKSKPTFLLDAWEKWNQREIGELLDPEVGEPKGELFLALARCIQIGLLCVQHSPEDRPDMPEVVAMLSDGGKQLPMPRKPTANSGAGPSVRLILDDTPGPSRAF